MDHDLEWGVEMDSSLAWRLGYEPFRKARPPSLDNVGMGARCAAYNEPVAAATPPKTNEELEMELLEAEYQRTKRLAQEKFGHLYGAYAEAFGLRKSELRHSYVVGVSAQPSEDWWEGYEAGLLAVVTKK